MKRNNVVHMGALMGDSSSPSPRASILPEGRSAANQLTRTFTYQSYFDDTLLQKAILEQPLGQPIIQSTLEEQQLSGYAIGNHPDSQTPVAVIFSGDGRQSGSASHIIPPGGIIRPTGSTSTDVGGFQSFSWGLPFGWLGGGTATIVVFQTDNAWAEWPARETAVLFHRFRAQILAPSGLPAAGSFTTNWPRNWPNRFPALNLQRGASSINQSGTPQIAIAKPGWTKFYLRTTVGTQSSIRALFYHTTDFDDELSATPSPIQLGSIDITVPARTPLAYPAGYEEYTFFNGPDELSQLGCNGKSGSTATLVAGVQFVSDDANLQGEYIDVARYGYL